LQSNPRQAELPRTRWRLVDVRQCLSWLAGKCLTSVSRILRRLGFSRKQAQAFVRSPDPNYASKRWAIVRAYAQLCAQPDQVRLVFLDEVTYLRQPSLAPAYHPAGPTQPRAQHLARPNTQTRVLATLDAQTGQVVYLQRNRITLATFVGFCAQLRAAYPHLPTLYVVLDNWPLHTHPRARAALDQHHLTPLFLPTYASWLNPIEKLWRWLRQDVLHLHPYATDLDHLRKVVGNFLDHFAGSSPALLHYVGLPVDQ
jgi:transposase